MKLCDNYIILLKLKKTHYIASVAIYCFGRNILFRFLNWLIVLKIIFYFSLPGITKLLKSRARIDHILDTPVNMMPSMTSKRRSNTSTTLFLLDNNFSSFYKPDILNPALIFIIVNRNFRLQVSEKSEIGEFIIMAFIEFIKFIIKYNKYRYLPGVGGLVISVSGLVGSVIGFVGSVTGFVGRVTGSVGSVTGLVCSVTGLVASVTGSVDMVGDVRDGLL